ncbi:MAG TPA: hypothetical protein VFC39_05410 [Acidobacteriaceae bacterium]|nr:hypothetical protein [Acidobacteriaceae bacterium]
MRRRHIILALALAAPALLAQKHGGRSAPPTAPPPQVAVPVSIVPASSGLGAIQFVQVNYGVPSPQSLTRQLRYDDDRTRAAALSAIGAPSQYLQRGHIPMPRAVELDLVPIGATDDDALLTVELDQHLVTAVLVQVDGNWRRIASFVYATPFDNGTVTPTTWLRTARSMVQKDRYRAIFHASTGSLTGNYTENEAHLRIVNGKPIVTISFESTARECTVAPSVPPGKPIPRSAARPGCEITQRWFQPDPADPLKKFELVTGTGHISPKDAQNPLANSRTMLLSQLRSFSCQPFIYSESTQHYEPSAPNGPCRNK